MGAGRASLLLLVLVSAVSAVTFSKKAPPPCSMAHSLQVHDGKILKNGSLHDVRNNIVYPRGTFWKEGHQVYRGCICKLKTCVRKCCKRYEYYDEYENCTRPGNLTNQEIDLLLQSHVFDLSALELNTTSNNNNNNNTYERFNVVHDGTCAAGMYRLEPHIKPDDEYFLLVNGSLHVPMLSTISFHEFCLDYFTDTNSVLPLVCFPDNSDPEDMLLYTVYPVGMLLSTVFLFLTLVTYMLLPDLRNLHGKLLMCHIASLLVAYLSLALVQLGTAVIPKWLCVTTAFMIEFTFAAAFFWLNIMCFDICWMFSGHTSSMRGSAADRDRRKLLIYSAYAWGCPVLLLVISAVMEFAPGLPEGVLKPNFGVDRCWFKDKLAIFAYFFGPISLLLLCNLVLFAVTAFRVVKLRRGTAVLKHADSQRSDQRENQQKFVLYLKLFVVMGMTWIMEVVSWTVGGSQYLWIITDICNTLQGLCIFLIFVWKPKVRRLLRARLSNQRPTSAQTIDGTELRSTNGGRSVLKMCTSSKKKQYIAPDTTSTSETTKSFSRPPTQVTSLIEDSFVDPGKMSD